ncbi:hypothetical protein FGU64_04560 [Mesorhizobium sp. 8]|nr:hypothetical protein FGU64_04560 [Mesorhizobium sp. 8]
MSVEQKQNSNSFADIQEKLPGKTLKNSPIRSAIPTIPVWLSAAIAEAYTANEPAKQLTAAVELDTDEACDAALRYLADAPASVEGQGGNDNAYRIACHLKDLGLSEPVALDFMDNLSDWNERCAPPWERDDLADILGHAYSYGQNSPGAKSAAADFDIITDWDEPANDNPAPTDDNRLSDARRTLARATLNLAALAGTAPPPREWLVQDWVPADVVTLFYGDGGTGKSLAALQLAAAVATGEPWFGIPVKAGRALYVTAEDDASELHRRLTDIASEQGVGLAELAGKLAVVSLAADDPTLAQASGDGPLKFTKLWHALAATIAELKPRLVVLDTLADVFAGNENIRAQARAFIGKLRKIGIDCKTNIVVLAHPSRDGLKVQGNSAAAGSSGSTAWHNSVRSRLVLERDDKTGLRTLHVAKSNYGGVGASVQLRWHAGAFVLAGGTVSQAEANAEADRVFLDMLDRYTAEGRHVSPNPGKTYAPSVFADDGRSGMSDSRALADAMNRLFGAGAIRVVEDGPPSKRREHIARSEPAAGQLAEAA